MSVQRLVPLALLALAAGCASGGGSAAPGTVQPERETVRAAASDTIYLVHHYVRAERRQQFEDFVRTVLWPAFERNAGAHPGLRSVRLLQPVQADADGSFTYTFLLDPYVRGEAYNVLELLQQVYSPEEALHQYGRFTETWARDFTTQAFVRF